MKEQKVVLALLPAFRKVTALLADGVLKVVLILQTLEHDHKNMAPMICTMISLWRLG